MIVVKSKGRLVPIILENVKIIKEVNSDLEIWFHNLKGTLKLFNIKLETFENLIATSLEKPDDIHILNVYFAYVQSDSSKSL
jgi:hypothetical protein